MKAAPSVSTILAALLAVAASGLTTSCQTPEEEVAFENGRPLTAAEHRQLDQENWPPRAQGWADVYMNQIRPGHDYFKFREGDVIVSGPSRGRWLKIQSVQPKRISYLISDTPVPGVPQWFPVRAEYELLMECDTTGGRSVLRRRETSWRFATRDGDGKFE